MCTCYAQPIARSMAKLSLPEAARPSLQRRRQQKGDFADPLKSTHVGEVSHLVRTGRPGAGYVVPL
jgi:hypothetical protein